MKILLLLTILSALVVADECPAKVLKLTRSNMQNYLKSYYKKVGNIKLNCNYEHSNNIFNIEHKLKAEGVFNKRKLNIDVKMHSSLFNLFDFSDLAGEICHSKFGNDKGKKDIELLRKSFLKKFAKNVTNKDIVKKERKGMICYSAKVAKKAKMRTLI